MTRRFTANEILERMGFPATAEGPYVEELRARVRKQVAEGMINRSGGTWGPEAATPTLDERAKALLAFEWEAERHSHRVEVLDPIVSRRRTVQEFIDGKFGRIEIRWRRIPAWLGDRWRELGMRWRVWIDARRGIVNPYRM